MCIFAKNCLMGRILAIDYGRKRVGIAVTDEHRIIAGGLCTLNVQEVIPFLKDYVAKENVDCIVVGEPVDMQMRASDASRYIEPFVKHLRKQFPDMAVERMDERFTSQMAMQTMRDAGLGKKARQNKSLVDTISATLILQSYMEKISNFRNQ
jgi:putative holliday junction resolvase